MDSEVLELTKALIQRPSVTPEDAGCLTLLCDVLEPLGFRCERIDRNGVSNLYAHIGSGQPHFAFAGHTDVVPSGPESDWQSPPFEPHVRGDLLFGRGAADMKSSLAAMVLAARDLLGRGPLSGRLSLLLTSDEEGPATDGTIALVEALQERCELPNLCLVGEPSSTARLGDVVRCGRRGSLNGRIRVTGIQGHVAYPEQIRNPIHGLARGLSRVCDLAWDRAFPDFPLTSLQVSNIRGGTGASNVVPGTAEAQLNLRFNPAYEAEELSSAIDACFADTDCTTQWQLSGQPFYTPPGTLRSAVAEAITQHVGQAPVFNTAGGTSDGRFIAPLGVEVVELGPVNASIHKIDEHVRIADLEPLRQIYRDTAAACLNPNVATEESAA